IADGAANIEFLGRISDKTKFELYSRCQAYINPQKEDFGITIVEAMASGRPVIALRKGGALETVIENKTGVFFNRESVDDVIAAVTNFNAGDFDSKNIREHAKHFSHENFKRQIRDYIKTEFLKFEKTE
ncbi:MAG: glycosyltransferase, partial [Patescibacteria group bacterium]|nr:glycosyltransferase [Patescibacteria group bacterium]